MTDPAGRAKRKEHIMVVGAHCGDAEIMGGAQVALYTKAGHAATIVHMTPGEKGNPPGVHPDTYAVQKRKEAEAAANVLGAEARFLPYKDGELPLNDTVKFQLADIIRERKPTVILTHWKGSIHKDHTNTSLLFPDALFYAAIPGFEREHPAYGGVTLLYAENWEDPHDFVVDTYVDVTGVFDTYWAALQEYELFRGGVSRFRYLDYYKALSVMRGCLAGCERAVGMMAPPGSIVRRGPSIPGHEL